MDLHQFLEQLKKWEESHSTDDHGAMIIGARDRKPEFAEVEVESEGD